jgi:type II secretory pathway pseudopilin PulG
MRRLKNQQGATLVLIIGVIAALAILAAAMVALTVNVQHNTATHRTQGKAFNVAEAGLDAGQAALWASWPADAAAGAALSVDSNTFKAQFDGAEFPDPATGQFIDVEFYDDDAADNQAPSANPGLSAAYDYDKNQNGYMWVVSRGATGSRAAKVQAMVKKVTFDMLIKEGVALFTEGLLETNGTGHQPVVGLDPPATTASVYAGGGWNSNGQADLEGGIAMNPDTTTTLGDVFPSDTLTYLIDAAIAAEKYYDAQADIPDEAWSSEPRLIVVDHGGIDFKGVPDTDIDASGNPTVWSEDEPGILIVLDGDVNQTGQKKTIYGIVYIVNGLLLRGNAEIHGMCVAKESADLRGTRAINYNANVLANINRPRNLSVKLVPEHVAELQPQ